jgi:transposase InsO family protein
MQLDNEIQRIVGARYLLNGIEHYSKYAWSAFFTNKTTENVIAFLRNTVLPRFTRMPQQVLTDNGGEFTSNALGHFLEGHNIRLIHGRPYHPQTQGAVERLNRTILSSLRKICIEVNPTATATDLKNRHKIALEIYNTRCLHRRTGRTPQSVFSADP